MSELRLHLGCSFRKIHGMVNVDADTSCSPDIVDDIGKLKKFKKNSVSYIYSSHALEHFSRADSYKVLRRWFKVLRPGGILRVAVPDIMAASRWLVEHEDMEAVRTCFWGSQRNNYDFHLNGFTFFTLRDQLQLVGFRDVKQYDWRNTDHWWVDDHSSSYLKRGDKENGALLSLNLECNKPL